MNNIHDYVLKFGRMTNVKKLNLYKIILQGND